MDFDDSYHSESEFYYPDELGNIVENVTENVAENVNMDESDESFMDEIQDYIMAQRPESTLKKTKYDMNVWRRYLGTQNETREVENIPPKELNVLMCRFFKNIKRKDGTAYEPVSLTSFQRSLQRHLNDKSSPINIFKDHEFRKSREVLCARKKELVVENAKGNRPQAARELTAKEEDELFRLGEFGSTNPEALQRTVWWLLSLHFGFRARDESRRLKWGDVTLSKDPATGNEFLMWKAERGSKTRHGDGHQRAFNPVAQGTNNERCPVMFYKEFIRRRPDEMKTPDSPFYLAINHKRKPDNPIWYCKSPLGKNEIGKFLVKAAQHAGIQGNISNHSVRKTCISRLMEADVPANFVAQLSGHKNLKSLDSYKTASVVHQQRMSHILSRSSQQFSTSSQSNAQFTTVNQPSTSMTISPQVTSIETSTKSPLPSASSLFSGSSIGKIEGCTFNFNYTSGEKQNKRRRILISDDSDSD